MSASKIRLNVLDQSPIRPGSTPRQALLETVELAQLADRLTQKVAFFKVS